MKKMFFAVLFGIFAAISISAQSKVDNFLGTWKMTKIEGGTEYSTIKSISMNVSLDGKELKIAQTMQGVNNNKAYTDTSNTSYKLNGAAVTEPAGGRFGGILIRYMTIHAPDKLEFTLGLKNDPSPSNIVGMVAVQLWTLSDDAKILTIETQTRHTKSIIIFSKQ